MTKTKKQSVRMTALFLAVLTLVTALVPISASAAEITMDLNEAEVSWDYTLIDEEGNAFQAAYGIRAEDNQFGHVVNPNVRSMHDYTVKRPGLESPKSEWVYGQDFLYCFCIEPGVPLPDSHKYKGSDDPNHGDKYKRLSTEQKNLLSLALAYGYPNRTDVPTSKDANACYAATQLVVWQIALGFRTSPTELNDRSYPVSGYSGTMTEQYTSNPYLKNYYDKILKDMEENDIRPSFATYTPGTAITYEMEYTDGKYSVTLTDTNNVLEKYYVSSNGGVSASINGNKLTLSSNNPLTGEVTVKLNRIIPSTTNTTTFLIWSVPDKESNNQDMVSGVPANDDPVPAFLKLETAAGSAKIVKTSEDGKVDGVKFRVEGNGVDQTVTTKNGGQIQIDNLRPGVYTVTEQTENKYEPQESRTVTVVSGKVATVTFNNKLKRGDLTVTKIAEDGLNEGVKFHLFGISQSGLAVDEYAVTDSSGKAYFRDVLIGTGYTLEEVGAPDRYVVPDDQTADIEWKKVTNKTFDNKLKRGNLTVTKVAEDGLDEGMRFHLYGTSYSGSKVDEYATVGKDGKAYFKDVLIGTGYTLEEVDTPDRYVVPDDQTADIEWNKVTNKDFDNKLKRGDLTVTKTAEDGLDEGIRFHLYGISLSGIAVNEYAVTDSSGKAYFKDILIGSSYTLEEVGTPDRYVIPDDQTADIEWKKVTNKSFDNKLKRGNLVVTKTAEDGLTEGMQFRLHGTSYSGLPVDETRFVGADGKAYFNDILIGTGYVLEEVGTPNRYVVPDDQTAEIEWEKVTNKDFRNTLKKWNVTVTKRDSETGTPQGDATLAGAVYGIYQGDELIDRYTTDADGKFTTKYYLCGDDWSLREITPSEGYLLDETTYHIGAEANNYTVEYNASPAIGSPEDVIKGKIAIIKHTDDGNTQIETPEVGAAFEVYLKSAGSYAVAKETERDRLVCDENGFAETKELPYGVYTVHQVSGWDGRELLPDFDVFVSKNNSTYRYLINNADFESYIKVVKTDAESGLPIPYAGAEFQIYDPDGNLVVMSYTYPTYTEVDTFRTNEDGYLITPQCLPYGTGYSLVEVNAPYGYVLNSEPVYFDVAADTATEDGSLTVVVVTRPNMSQKGVIHISKTGEVFQSVVQSGDIYKPVYEIKGLADAVYDIYAADDIQTPDGTLHYAKGELVDTVTTDADGVGTSKELYLGKYEIKETKAPHGMVLNSEAKTVELVYAGQDVAVTETSAEFYNIRQKVEVSLRKQLKQNELFGIGMNEELANITFGLYAAEDLIAGDGSKIPAGGLIEIVTFDADGNAVCKTDLPLGSYYLQERSTNAHYILNTHKYDFTFDYAGQEIPTVELQANGGEPIPNELKYGSVSGLKIDEDGETIEGALFGLFRNDETEFTEETALLTAVSDKDGRFRFEDIPYGTWIVRELKPAEGFVLNEKSYPVIIEEDEQVVEITMENRHIYGDVEGLKLDEDGEIIEGALFGLFSEDETEFTEETALMTELSGPDGKFRFEHLRYGKYQVRELVPAEGFVLNETVYPVNVEEDGEVIEIQFENRYIRGDILGHKVDEDGVPVVGALFGLFLPEDTEFTEENAVLTAVSGEDGIFRFEDIHYGSWVVRELKPAEGFVLNETAFPVEVKTDGEVIEIEAENRHIYGGVATTKVDRDYPDHHLTGAVFEIWQDVNGNGTFDDGTDILIGLMNETATGIYTKEQLRYGKYLLHEKTAPEGFVLDEAYYPFAIEHDGEIVIVENSAGVGFINQPKVGNLKIVKSSSDGKLEGFSFRIEGENYSEIFTTDENGEIFVEGLRLGQYIVTEVADDASAGYKRPEPVTVELAENETLTVEMYNEKDIPDTPDIPQTGDNSNMPLLIGLMLASLGGLCVTLAMSRRRKYVD